MSADGSILDHIIASQQVVHRDKFKPVEVLAKLLELLPEREQQILLRRFALRGGECETLEYIGKTLHVTRERVRQIERLAIEKLRDSSEAKAYMQPLKQVVVEVMENEGGAVQEQRLVELLAELAPDAPAQVLEFYLDEVLTDVLERVLADGGSFVSGWRLRTASIVALEALVSRAEEIISSRGAPMAEDELARQLAGANLASLLSGTITDGALAVKLLGLSARVHRNSFGEWGLKHWQTITPKRMNDKIYLVLKKQGKPLHFRDIVRLINEQHFDGKQAYAPTVHNELILDKKFVLVGRGIYALTEWGYQPGVVADVLESILKEHGEAMGRDELVEQVLKQRLVKKGTVYLALTNRRRFLRLPDGRYTVAQGSVA
jgi:hypothetical protein